VKEALLASLLILGAAAPAVASSVPRVDYPPNATMVSAGIYDVDLDHAIGDRLALGVNTNFLSVAARLSYRLGGQPGGACWGFTLSGGPSVFPAYAGIPSAVGVVPVQVLGSYFFQPAFTWAAPLGPYLIARGTLGPVFFSQLVQEGASYRYLQNMVVPLWPNIELAIPVGWGEITLGGGLVGARLTF
jgi:hypothetical protein